MDTGRIAIVTQFEMAFSQRSIVLQQHSRPDECLAKREREREGDQKKGQKKASRKDCGSDDLRDGRCDDDTMHHNGSREPVCKRISSQQN